MATPRLIPPHPSIRITQDKEPRPLIGHTRPRRRPVRPIRPRGRSPPSATAGASWPHPPRPASLIQTRLLLPAKTNVLDRSPSPASATPHLELLQRKKHGVRHRPRPGRGPAPVVGIAQVVLGLPRPLYPPRPRHRVSGDDEAQPQGRGQGRVAPRPSFPRLPRRQPAGGQWVRSAGPGGGPGEPAVVRAGGAGEWAVGDAGRGRDADPGGADEGGAHQRAAVVRRRQVGVLRVVVHALRHRVHPLPLRRDPAVAGHQEPRQRQPGPHLQELQPPAARVRVPWKRLQPSQLRPHPRGQGEGARQREAGDAGVPGVPDPAQRDGQGAIRQPAAAPV